MGASLTVSLDFSGAGMASLGTWLTESEDSPERQRSSGRPDILWEGYLKSTGAGHSRVLRDEPAGTTRLAEQSFVWSLGKKQEFMIFERWGSNSGGLQR